MGGGNQPECLWVNVGQERIRTQLQLDHLWQVVEGPSLHHQQLLHIVETEREHKDKSAQRQWLPPGGDI